jgi:tetratricopeptide (TPR) repeat protein
VRSLVETHVLEGDPGSYRLAKDPIAIQVPATVQAILAARIDRLAPVDKELLQTASVIGKDVPWALLQGTVEMAEDGLRRGLARLQAGEFIYEAKLFPDLEYTFKHALTHEVAYGGLLQDRRRALHVRTLAAIERVYAGRLAEHVDSLAHHAFRGAAWSKAIHYLRQAWPSTAKPSIDEVFGGPENAGHLWFRGEHDRALTLAQRDRAVSATFKNFGGTIVANYRLGQIYHSLGECPKATDHLRRNVEQLDGDLQRQTFGLAGFPAVFSRVWLAFCLVEMGELGEAAARAEEALAIAEAEDHVFSVIVPPAGTGVVQAQLENLEEAIASLERGLVMGRMSDLPILFPLVAAPLGWVYARTEKLTEAQIPGTSPGFGRADATDVIRYPYMFPDAYVPRRRHLLVPGGCGVDFVKAQHQAMAHRGRRRGARFQSAPAAARSSSSAGSRPRFSGPFAPSMLAHRTTPSWSIRNCPSSWAWCRWWSASSVDAGSKPSSALKMLIASPGIASMPRSRLLCCAATSIAAMRSGVRGKFGRPYARCVLNSGSAPKGTRVGRKRK